MPTLPKPGPLALLAATALLALMIYLDWPRVGAYWLAARQHGLPPATHGLDLASYHATTAGQPIEGLRANVSGLSWSSATQTLFTVINRPAAVAELSTDGRLLREIPLPWLPDPEGISHVRADLFVVSSEASHTLYWLRIPAGSQEVQRVATTQLPLDFDSWPNLGLEGISWDEERQQLLLVNEKWPRKVLLVDGLTPAQGGRARPAVHAWRPQAWLGFLGRDLTSLTTNPASGDLVLLSEQSGLITEYSRQGDILGVLPLWRGFAGLTRTVPQPEGLTLGADNTLYIVSEPNLFYRLEPARTASRQRDNTRQNSNHATIGTGPMHGTAQ